MSKKAGQATQAVRNTFQHAIKRSYLWKVKAEMKNFREALDMALNPLRYDRKALYAFYRECELDDQVITQKRVATVTVQRAPYEVIIKGKANEDATRYFKKMWFHDLLGALVVTELWGHSLFEFDEARDQNGEFQTFNTLPRDHVRPEYGDVTINLSDFKGIPYRDGIGTEYPLLLEAGNPFNVGLYHVVCIPMLRKRFSDTDWSMFSERFGSPFITVKTQSRDPKELDKKEAMLSGFASNSYAILDEGDEISFQFANHNGTAHLTFRDRMDRADDQIARIINGQTSTSDEKAHVGSAEVHERLLNDFVFERLTRIQYWINTHLIPFLIRQGYPLQGAIFEFIELRPKQNITVNETNEKDPERQAQKKSPRMNFSLHYNPYFHSGTCNCPNCQEADA